MGRDGTIKRAQELIQRPVSVIETYHNGALPQINSFLSVDKDNVIVGAMKNSEDGDDLIIRLYETSKVATDATITLPQWGRTIKTTFGPCEIKTFRVSKDASVPVCEVNMIEW
ncbi:Glycosyl hydrolases family 38 C-terminal domain-containing protein [Paenibacillus sp. UNC496MF]|uniref:glycosyl hydrolase-related protein n=1 Tax=Paenibacillus sp. UNC496MF TaxID=1502753 RepID=UPI0008EE8081|nr:glycosyl hydrolase-related protein [Paenibacillus sp. UNC496MF]SFJ76795.1 Glycosyl hydrolases family 38 C-terminal domain-containing protein [Paenibacillus sp. UNC496MF]